MSLMNPRVLHSCSSSSLLRSSTSTLAPRTTLVTPSSRISSPSSRTLSLPLSHRRTYTSSASPSPTMGAIQPPSEWEAQIKRNPHPDFKKVESSRPPFDPATTFHYTQTPQPSWTPGHGANTPAPSSASHLTIDPHEPGRPAGFNYKLLISAIVPRPIAFVSTRSADGSTTTSTNLAPFSYFQMVAHDPPLFVIGFASALSPEDGKTKDTLRNLAATGECVINMISESFVEAANVTSVNAPPDVSEWDVSGLTPVYDCQTVKCARVKEAVFSVEAKLESLREFDSRATPGKKSGTLAVVEGTRFWVREDAINEERNIIDPAVLRPVSRLGGITYARTTQAFELPRPDFEKDIGGREAVEALKKSKKEAEAGKTVG